MTEPQQTLTIGGPADEPLLDAFYRGIYHDAFAHQREPVEVWKDRLWGGAPPPYKLTIRIAGTGLRDPSRREIHGGIVFEHYPRSGCSLLTYAVVSPDARRQGLGRRLVAEAVRSLATEMSGRGGYVFGEVSDPGSCAAGDGKLAEAWSRIERFQRWGHRVIDARYVQPRLGPGLQRDRDLLLMVFSDGSPLPPAIRGEQIGEFVDELFEITEGAPPVDPELTDLREALHGPVRLKTLSRPTSPI